MKGLMERIESWVSKLFTSKKDEESFEFKKEKGRENERSANMDTGIQPEKRLAKIKEEEELENFLIIPQGKYAVTDTGQIIRMPEKNKARRKPLYKKEPRL